MFFGFPAGGRGRIQIRTSQMHTYCAERGGLVWRTLSTCGALPTDVDQFGYHLA